MKSRFINLLLCLLVFFALYGSAEAKGGSGIIKSKHNLSVAGPGRVKSSVAQPVCSFCHVPHNVSKTKSLWHRKSKVTYITYKSSTLKAAVGQPTGTSRLCLTCHDGSIALGMIRGKQKLVPFYGGVMKLPPGKANLGLDLSDDHPISFVFDNALAVRNRQLRHPGTLTGPVKLDEDRQLQCTTCHDPHSDLYGKFLVVDNNRSALCVTCHDIDHWSRTSHSYSAATWNNAGPNPWPNTSYITVAANGCENCHQPHNAEGRQRLLRHAVEEENCFTCHNGNVAEKNIKKEFNKPSRHPIERTRGIHEPLEPLLWGEDRHVECLDCHNPHAVNAAPANVPLASGKISEVGGVSSSGSPVRPLKYEYELCYRCHADNPGRSTPVVTRYFFEKNLRRKFLTSNASYHPLEAAGKNRDVPSLIVPLTTSSRIYCTDCHNSDAGRKGSDAPRGPHGSIWRPLLERQMMTADYTTENSSAYALCYKCHNRNSILGDQSFPEHRRHVVDVRAPCTACHDPHGVEDNTHLINFDKTIVDINKKSGNVRYEETGRFSGACSLSCHGEEHDRREYPFVEDASPEAEPKPEEIQSLERRLRRPRGRLR